MSRRLHHRDLAEANWDAATDAIEPGVAEVAAFHAQMATYEAVVELIDAVESLTAVVAAHADLRGGGE